MWFRKPCQYCDTGVKITYPQLPVNGKHINDDEFLHTVNVSFALVTDSENHSVPDAFPPPLHRRWNAVNK